MMKYIDVAVGVILRDNQTYVCLRASDKHQGGKWEFPGGKVEEGEAQRLYAHLLLAAKIMSSSGRQTLSWRRSC